MTRNDHEPDLHDLLDDGFAEPDPEAQEAALKRWLDRLQERIERE